MENSSRDPREVAIDDWAHGADYGAKKEFEGPDGVRRVYTVQQAGPLLTVAEVTRKTLERLKENLCKHLSLSSLIF